MGFFRNKLLNEVRDLISALERKERTVISHSWSWLNPKDKSALEDLENLDLTIISEIKKLHKKGKDIPALTTRILLLANEVLENLESLKKESKVSKDKATLL
tara:strand:+ start:776 stop:1081 length:306 start_codon:yes stop_codon:yes gene_type:complete